MKSNKLHLPESRKPQPRRQPLEPASPETWNESFKDWLTAQASENTRRAYRSAWIAFRKDTGLRLSEVDTAAITDWVATMTAADLTTATIHQRLAAISSFYKHALRAGLCRTNPADPVPRPHHEPYSRARALDPDQARALLAAIPRDTRQGKRDFALFATVLITGRPITEICQLRFGDLQPCGEQVWIFWPGLEKPAHAPAILWRAIRDFLHANGQLGSIHKDDYLFTPLTDHATHLPNVPTQSWDACQPISTTMVGRLIKKYAHRAGLDPAGITLQTLRYTAASLRSQAGADPQQIADLLGYADPATADRLLRQLQVNTHPPWQKIQSILQPEN